MTFGAWINSAVEELCFFLKAAAAMKKYPLPLSCGKEAMILDNIGKFFFIYLTLNNIASSHLIE